MACRFDVILNPGAGDQISVASSALDLVGALEDQMSVYRPASELSRLNREAAAGAVRVEPKLFDLLARARDLCLNTEGCFDPTSGPLISLWQNCRKQGRIPDEGEIAETLRRRGIEHLHFDRSRHSIKFDRPGVELNLGGIGKGYALDQAAALLRGRGIHDYLIHGGHSSLLAEGEHAGQRGWPIGIRNPLFPKNRIAILRLNDSAMSTSGCGVQSFRHGGRRYGHILDPRSGWPVESMLSVTVLARTAADADALSTAFFVMGVEKSQEYCHNNQNVMALLIPPPCKGRKLEPINCGIPDDWLAFTHDGTVV